MVAGAPRNFEDKFKFLIEIKGIVHVAFQKCSELKAEFDKIEYREGGTLIPTVKDPGLLNWSDITLERGAVADDSDLYDWFEEVADFAANTGRVNPEFKRNLSLIIQDRDNTVLKRWNLSNVWPLSFTAGEWDNDASDKTIEMVTLTFDGAKRRTS